MNPAYEWSRYDYELFYKLVLSYIRWHLKSNANEGKLIKSYLSPCI